MGVQWRYAVGIRGVRVGGVGGGVGLSGRGVVVGGGDVGVGVVGVWRW